MQLKTADVFWSCLKNVLRPKESLEFVDVVSVSVDGAEREVSDSHVLHQANADFRSVLFVGRHDLVPAKVLLRLKPQHAWQSQKRKSLQSF